MAFIATSVVIAGVLTTVVTLVHHVLGINKVFGVLKTRGTLSEMLTTFPNENHAAGFMVGTFGKSCVFCVTTSRLFAKAVAAIKLSRSGNGLFAELT